MAVDQEDAERLADRHDQPAPVVQGERVVVDRNLDQMVARAGELMAEDDRDILARRQIERFLGARAAVDSQPRGDAVGAGVPKLCKTARSRTLVPTVTTGASRLSSVTARFSPPDLPEVDHHRPRLAGPRAAPGYA